MAVSFVVAAEGEKSGVSETESSDGVCKGIVSTTKLSALGVSAGGNAGVLHANAVIIKIAAYDKTFMCLSQCYLIDR